MNICSRHSIQTIIPTVNGLDSWVSGAFYKQSKFYPLLLDSLLFFPYLFYRFQISIFNQDKYVAHRLKVSLLLLAFKPLPIIFRFSVFTLLCASIVCVFSLHHLEMYAYTFSHSNDHNWVRWCVYFPKKCNRIPQKTAQ